MFKASYDIHIVDKYWNYDKWMEIQWTIVNITKLTLIPQPITLLVNEALTQPLVNVILELPTPGSAVSLSYHNTAWFRTNVDVVLDGKVSSLHTYNSIVPSSVPTVNPKPSPPSNNPIVKNHKLKLGPETKRIEQRIKLLPLIPLLKL